MSNNAATGYRLSPQQTHLWLSPEGLTLRAQCGLVLEGTLDGPALREALRQVVARHEILRTTYHRRPGMKVPLQVIGDEALVDWRKMEGEAEKGIAQLLREEARRPFDFERGPLVRAVLHRLAPTKHVLTLTLPAVCTDTRSMVNLVRELVTIYGSGDPGEVPVQYADFSEWQHQLLEEGDEGSEEAKRFWSEAVANIPGGHALPFQGQGGAAAGFAPDVEVVTLARETMNRVAQVAKEGETSSDVVLLSAWATLLSRLTGEVGVPMGVVLDGRKQEELQGALGLVAQTLPVPAAAESGPFVQLVRQLRDAGAGATRYQEYFAGDDKITLAAQFESEKWPTGLSGRGVVFKVSHLSCDVSRYGLKLSCGQQDDGWTATFAFDPSLVGKDDIQRVARYFTRLLAGVTRDAGAPAGQVNLLDEVERRQLLVELNQTAAAYPADKCLHQVFEEQAERTPDRPALAFEGKRLTYQELNEQANRLAHHLRCRGVGRNVRVGLCLERSADMIVGVLGILKAGGAYVPLHPDLPRARLAHLITETQAPLVVTQERLLERIPPVQAEAVCVDRDAGVLAKQPATNPERINRPEDLVYVIYTSGSTGVPKGVANRHRNLVNYTSFIAGRLGLERPEHQGGLHFATVSTLSADLGNTCIFPALVSGGCLHVIDYETSMTGSLFVRYTAENGIDVLKITSSHLGSLLAATDAGAVLPRKYLILGGEASTWELVGRVKAAGKCAVINHYGPTETTVGSLTFDVDRGDACRGLAATVPVGRPIANTRVYILDAGGRPVPKGVAGELYIGGAGVALGYLNQPEQTAEGFLKDPFAGEPDARMYKTGDRVRYLPDGNIEFLGRLDQQVKIRGFRVEPAEVEQVLRGQAAVREAVVIAQDDINGEKRLVAYYVPEPGRTVTTEQLRSQLLERLPDYMVPGVFVTLPALPLTPNGKVDTKALPAPGQAAAGTKGFVAPRNPVEETLAGIWREVLKRGQVGAFDNFFELGGHSLLATQVISRVCSILQVQVPLRVLFETPTVAGLAEAVAQAQASKTDDAELAKMLAELEGLSEEEVQQLLAAEMQQEAN
jgi:amino acid adenylation domain-containing protein